MTSEGQISKDWDIMDHSETQETPTEPQVQVAEANLTIHTKKDTSKTIERTSNMAPSRLVRKASDESILSIVSDEYMPPPPPRHSGCSMPMPPPPRPSKSIRISSSTNLLSKVNTYDGMVNLPTCARSSVYLATFPFTDRDVRKWDWVMGAGVEDTWMQEMNQRPSGRFPNRYDDGGYRGRSAYGPGYCPPAMSYGPHDGDIPAIFLSNVLDLSVVPEEKDVQYLIIVKHRAKPLTAKLLVADSRKGASVLIFYEAINGNSIVFVGATVKGAKFDNPERIPRFKRVESLDEAAMVHAESDGGVVGLFC